MVFIYQDNNNNLPCGSFIHPEGTMNHTWGRHTLKSVLLPQLVRSPGALLQSTMQLSVPLADLAASAPDVATRMARNEWKDAAR